MNLPVTREIAARAAGAPLPASDKTRYSRHLLLPEVGEAGQKRLKAARVLVVGAGGLGSPVSLYLAAAGIGTLGLAEFDEVDASNLQRQILYEEADRGSPKLAAAVRRLKALNSGIDVVTHPQRVTAGTVLELVGAYDLVVDGTDNFATRYLVSDACGLVGKPYVYGSVLRFGGQASVYYPPLGPCYRCLFPAPPPPGRVPSCAEGGVLGAVVGQVGTIQATEALKLILGIGEPLIGRLLLIDALTTRFSEFKIPRDPGCPLCGEAPTITTIQESVRACGVTSGEADLALGASPTAAEATISVPALHQLRTEDAPHLLIDVRTPAEAAICSIDGAQLIPLSTLDQRLGELPRDRPLVVHCKSGQRSAQAVALLHSHGFSLARSLEGGILAWIDALAPELARY